MKLSENFSLEEMVKSETAVRRGIKNTPNSVALMRLHTLCIEILQPLRERWGSPIRVTSGFRCDALNKIVGGASNSQHIRGEAADIVSEDNRGLFLLIESMISNGELKVGQLIDEKNYRWLHISLPDSRHFNQILHL